MKKLLVTFMVAAAFLVGGMHDGHGAVAPWKTSYGPGFMTEGGGGGGYPHLGSHCPAQGMFGTCIRDAAVLVPCYCIKIFTPCGPMLVWQP